MLNRVMKRRGEEEDEEGQGERAMRRRIERYMAMLNDEKTMQRGLNKLEKMEMTLERLSETGVGKAVNQLRYHHQWGELAMGIVDRWKAIARSRGLRSRQSVDEDLQEKVGESSLQMAIARSRGLRSRQSVDEDLQEKVGRLRSRQSVDEDLQEKVEHKNKLKLETTKGKGPSFDSMLAAADSKTSLGRKMKKPKLELHQDWAQTRPDPHYHPRRPLLADYEPKPIVFNDESVRAVAKQCESTALDPEMFSARKANKRKIYAGKPKDGTFGDQVPRLFDLCLKMIGNHIHALEDTGDIPFDILKPVLEKCNARQLIYIENRNPYLAEDSECLWEKLCQRHCPEATMHDDETWRQCFLRIEMEREEHLRHLSTKISKHVTEAALPTKKTKLSDAKTPRDVRRRQMKNGTATVSMTLPSAIELSAARRAVATDGREALLALPVAVRNGTGKNSSGFCPLPSSGRKVQKKAVLMVKTLRMLGTKKRR